MGIQSTHFLFTGRIRSFGTISLKLSSNPLNFTTKSCSRKISISGPNPYDKNHYRTVAWNNQIANY